MIFAYAEGHRWFAWEVARLPLETKESMIFWDSLGSHAKRVHFRRGHPREGSSDVRPTFYHKSGEGGTGESLTHLLFKEAFAAINRVTFSGIFDQNVNFDLQQVNIEKPIYVDPSTTLRIDVFATIAGPKGVINYWGNELGIEIEHTHQTEFPKKQVLHQRRIPCIEVAIPANLIISDEENFTEKDVTRHQSECIAFLKANAVPAKIISSPIAEEYLKAKIHKLEDMLDAVTKRLNESEVSRKALTVENERTVADINVTKKMLGAANESLRQQKAEVARLSQEIKRLNDRNWWQRLRNI